MAIKINCIPSGTFPHFLEHEKEETLSVYLEAAHLTASEKEETLSVYLEAVKWALLEE